MPARPVPAVRWWRRRTAASARRGRVRRTRRRPRPRRRGWPASGRSAGPARRPGRGRAGGEGSLCLEREERLLERVRLDLDPARRGDRLDRRSCWSPSVYSNSCSGEEWTWISPGLSAVTSSSIGWPTADLDQLTVRVHRVTVERHVDHLGRLGPGRPPRQSWRHRIPPGARRRAGRRRSPRPVDACGVLSRRRTGEARLGRSARIPWRNKTRGTGGRMNERLRARDLWFLTCETRRRRCTTPRWRSSTRGRRASTTTRWCSSSPTGSPSCRATASACAGSPATSRTRSGWTTRTSTSATTCAARRCPVRGPWTSSASLSPGSSPGRSTATARCGRSTWSRGWRTAGSRCSPRPTRRWWTAPRSSTSPRCCSTGPPSGASSAPTSGGPGGR